MEILAETDRPTIVNGCLQMKGILAEQTNDNATNQAATTATNQATYYYGTSSATQQVLYRYDKVVLVDHLMFSQLYMHVRETSPFLTNDNDNAF